MDASTNAAKLDLLVIGSAEDVGGIMVARLPFGAAGGTFDVLVVADVDRPKVCIKEAPPLP